jgi:pimeloyl-ACP methyl ester carboxylesterase
MITKQLDVGDAVLTYDVREPESASAHRPLMMIGQPMAAEGFTTLASHFTDRTVITYDQRGLGRSTRSDGTQRQRPEVSADDLHAIVTAAGLGPVDVFGSSGGAVNGLAWVALHPADVATLVAHEPPIVGVLPDAENAFAAERAVQERYQADGWGAGMAAFIAMTMAQGEFTEEFLAQPHPDPAAFGLPTEDDGSRDDPLLSGAANDVTAFRPDPQALAAADTRVVIALGVESASTLTGRTSAATADLLGLPLIEFPSHHGGFLGGEFGQHGEPEAFAARLHEVLDS